MANAYPSPPQSFGDPDSDYRSDNAPDDDITFNSGALHSSYIIPHSHTSIATAIKPKDSIATEKRPGTA